MYIRMLIHYGKWAPGATPDVHRDTARRLIAEGIAAPHDGLTLTEAQQTAKHVNSNKEDTEQTTPTPTVIVVDNGPSHKFKRRAPKKQPPNSKKA